MEPGPRVLAPFLLFGGGSGASPARGLKVLTDLLIPPRGGFARQWHEMLSGVGDVLGELGDEVQRIKDLEVAGDIAEEIGACGPGKPPGRILLGQVEDLALVCDPDHALEAEGTAQHVLGETLASGEVVGVEPDRKVHSEAGRRSADRAAATAATRARGAGGTTRRE